MLIEVQTSNGPRKARVCDYCQTVCIPSGRFCSGFCARGYAEREKAAREQDEKKKVLIAAASMRLYEACKTALGRLNNPLLDTSLFDDVKDQLTAAVAKAEGKTPCSQK